MNIIEDLKWQYKSGGFEQKLIYWNIATFLISLIFFYQFKIAQFIFPDWLALSSNPIMLITRPWTLLSYSFFHAGFFHLLFNMVVLNFSGRMFLTFFSQKQFLGLYLLSAIFAGLAFVISYVFLGVTNAQIVGASAAIMAILIAAATYAPMMNIRLLLIGNVKLWQFAFVIIVLDILQILSENTGGHISHLAGAFFGFIFIKFLQAGTDLSKGVTIIFDAVENIRKPKKANPFKKVHRNYKQTPVKKEFRIITKEKSQQQVDEILDKISRSGYDSLTSQEKEFLFKSGKE